MKTRNISGEINEVKAEKMSIRGETKVEICGVAIWVGRCFLSMVIECRIKVTHIIF